MVEKIKKIFTKDRVDFLCRLLVASWVMIGLPLFLTVKYTEFMIGVGLFLPLAIASACMFFIIFFYIIIYIFVRAMEI